MKLSAADIQLEKAAFAVCFLLAMATVNKDYGPDEGDESKEGKFPKEADGSIESRSQINESGEGHTHHGPRTKHRPGPIRPSEPSLGVRHMADPIARILAGAMFAKVFLMPSLYAADAQERAALTEALIEITGIAPLLQDGRISGCTVCWSNGRFPKYPTEIRIALPGGEAERRRRLGAFEPHLRKMVAALLPTTPER